MKRLCSCGCGRDVEKSRKNAMYRIECRAARDSERHAERYQAAKPKNRSHERKQRAALHPGVTRVSSRVTWRDDPNRRQAICSVCCGLPWARLPTRIMENGRAPAGDDLMCRGCGEPWAPEPAPDPCEVLRSSAGMTARQGELDAINGSKSSNR